MVNRFERGLLPAIETLAELDLGDRARTEISNVSGIGTVVVTSTIADVRVVSRRLNTIITTTTTTTTTITIGAKGEGIGLRTKRDGGRRSRVEEQVLKVCGVLSLNETIKLLVRRSFLAKDRFPKSRRIRSEVWRSVLLSLAIFYGRSDHLGLSSSIELTRGVCRVE